MQSNIGAYEVRRDPVSEELLIAPISQYEFINRQREQDLTNNNLFQMIEEFDSIHTFFSVQRVIEMINIMEGTASNISKPTISIENFEKLEKCNDVTDCSICFENKKENIKLNCEHIFCNRCIKKWLTEKSNTCPTCRKEIVL
tara:strand:- start:20089 stop:20517 length:429 start_codon:yes stop_codon:yes gene_type:complete